METQKMRFLIFLLVILAVLAGVVIRHPDDWPINNLLSKQSAWQGLASAAASVSSPFTYSFQVDGILNETGGMGDSSSPYWWLNSGGQMWLSGGTGKTIQGDAPLTNKWRGIYILSNPLDTDKGLHPQNIFRLVTRSKWQQMQQEAYFIIHKTNMSASPNRNASNGLLLFNRYQDGTTLYYMGIRVDGYAVIKKKINGIYYTLAYKPVYASSTALYNRDTNPNLLPLNQWIGMRSVVTTNADQTVSIQLYVDKNKTGNWTLVAQAKDDGKSFRGGAILNEGYAGIRTDFMDVEFDNLRLTKL